MRGARLILFLTIFVAMLGLSVLFPVMAPLARELGLTETQVGLFAFVYSLAQFITAPTWGARSERVGRKPILVMGLLGFALAQGIFGAAAALGLAGQLGGWALLGALIASRLIGGALSGATLPTAQAFMADLSDEKSRTAAMGMIGAAFGLGIVFGPGLGALLSTYGLLIPVYFSAALGLITAAFAALVLRETRAPTPGSTDRPDWTMLARPGVTPLLAISALYTLASVGMEQTIGFLVQDRLNLESTEATRTIGLMLTFFGLTVALVQGGAIRPLTRKYSPTRLIPAGLILMGGGMLLIPLASGFWGITAALAVVGIGTALLGPSLTGALSLRFGPDDQGRIAGLGASALSLGRMIGPVIATLLYQHVHIGSPYVFSGLLLLALLAAVAPLNRTAPLVSADD